MSTPAGVQSLKCCNHFMILTRSGQLQWVQWFAKLPETAAGYAGGTTGAIEVGEISPTPAKQISVKVLFEVEILAF